MSIKSHHVNDLNKNIGIEKTQERWYRLSPQLVTVRTFVNELLIPFQNGDPKEVGMNGYTNEALLAVVLHRLQEFQKGARPCRQNAIAITKIEEALMWLGHRSKEIEEQTNG